MAKFSDFVKEDISCNKNYRKEVKKEDVSELIDKYSTYSEDDLMKEFLEESKKQKDSGELSNEKISKIKSVLSPYLDEQQKQKLEDLIKMVK